MNAAMRIRKRAGLSREQLAKEAGVGLSTVKRLELDWGECTTGSLKKIAAVLNVLPGDLITQNGSNTNAS